MTLTKNHKIAIGVTIGVVLLFLYVKKIRSECKAGTLCDNWSNQSGLDYKALADQIFNAENGCATDLNTVIDVYSQLKTPADFANLSEAFGKRIFTECWMTHPVDTLTGTNTQSLDMESFLRKNLSQDEFTNISNILVANGAAVISNNPFE